MSTLKNFSRITQHEGLAAGFQWLVERAQTRYYEWRLGIHSDTLVSLEEMGVNNDDFRPYVPSDYRTLVRVLNSIEIKPKKDVFVDFGSGMGRVVILAATKPFRRVIGVEMNEQLNQAARENLRQALPHLKCSDIELVTSDATLFDIPPEATFFYFANPFCGEVLDRVLENIRQSARSSPRPVTLICRLPAKSSFEETMLRQTWLRQRKELVFEANIKYRIFDCEGSIK